MGNIKSKYFETIQNLNQKDSKSSENPNNINVDNVSTDDENENEKQYSVIQKQIEKNPGAVEDAHKECKRIIPDFYEGAHFIIYKLINNNMQISHQIRLMPETDNSFYRFGFAYVGTKISKIHPNEFYPIFYSEISPNGFLQANFIHKMLKNDSLRLRYSISFIRSSLIDTIFLADYFGKKFTTSFGIINPSILNNSGVLIFQHLQGINSNLSIGSEIIYDYGFYIVPNTLQTNINAIIRYRTNDNSSIITSSVGHSGIHLSYFKEINSQLRLGIELQTNINSIFDTVCTIGYEISLLKCDLIYRGSIDTNLNVRCVLEKKLLPLPFTFTLCALINHRINKFRLGCGINIGG